MPDNDSVAVDQPASPDLISFLKAIPDGRYRRGVRYPQWFLLLVVRRHRKLSHLAADRQSESAVLAGTADGAPSHQEGPSTAGVGFGVAQTSRSRAPRGLIGLEG